MANMNSSPILCEPELNIFKNINESHKFKKIY